MQISDVKYNLHQSIDIHEAQEISICKAATFVEYCLFLEIADMADTEEPGSQKIHVEASEARHFVEAVLRGNGVSPENAAIVARCLVAADLRGVDTHG